MKKLLAIIFILITILIGMYIYKNNLNKNKINISEVEQIEQYLKKIYMWKEVTKEALPKFDDINNAPDLWTWEVVKNNLENYESTYEEIQEKAKEIFGENFKKTFPKEGSDYIIYEEDKDKYYVTGTELDSEEDLFLLNNIEKTAKGYEIQLVEYIEDYSEILNTENENLEKHIYIKNLEGQVISNIKNSESETTETIEIVKQNIDKFTTKIVNLEIDKNGKIFIVSVK